MPESRLRLVRSEVPYGKTCDCGECRKCRNRERMRAYRASNPIVRAGMMGPRMTLKRRCERCSDFISDANRTGFCTHCQTNHRDAYVLLRRTFTDGGGI